MSRSPSLSPAQIRRVRERLRLTQDQMAQLLGLSFATVNRYETGHQYPTEWTCQLLVALRRGVRGRRDLNVAVEIAAGGPIHALRVVLAGAKQPMKKNTNRSEGTNE